MIKKIIHYIIDSFDFINIKLLFRNVVLHYRHMDRVNMILVIALNIIGFLMIFSSSSMSSWYSSLTNGNPYFFIQKQAMWLFLSVIIYFYILAIPLQKLYRYAWLLGVVNIVLLLGVLVVGIEINNAKSWYDLKVMTLQPAEFVKIGMILFLAWYFDGIKHVNNWLEKRGTFLQASGKLFFSTLFPVGYIMIIFGLVFIQPDLGSAMSLFFIGCIMFLISGISIKWIISLITVGTFTITPIIYYIVTKTSLIQSYQLKRFEIWRDPFIDPLGYGYQLINGYIAIALGGISGVGIGSSEQKLGFIPEPYNDFIATIIAEETGLIGIVIVVVIYLLFALRSLKLALLHDESIFLSLIAVGVGAMIFMQAFINLGGVSGLIPLTGITLPFISYGGSSLMSLFIGIGLLQNVSASYNKHKKTRNNRCSPE